MKLRLLATASTHTANFKVMAAEYRFAAEGLEMLTPDVKGGLLNVASKLSDEEKEEIGAAMHKFKDKTGLAFLKSVISECAASPGLKSKAEQIGKDIAGSIDNKKESSFGKNSGWFKDLLFTPMREVWDQTQSKSTLNKIMTISGTLYVRLGIVIMVTAAMYILIAIPHRELFNLVGFEDLTNYFDAGSLTSMIGLGINFFASMLRTLGLDSTKRKTQYIPGMTEEDMEGHENRAIKEIELKRLQEKGRL